MARAVGRRSVRTEVRRPAESMLIRMTLFVFTFIEVLIGARFLLRLFAANSQVPVVEFVYKWAAFFMTPFEAIFPTAEVVEGSVIEWSALAAVAGYVLVAWGLTELVKVVTPRRHADSVEQVVEEDNI